MHEKDEEAAQFPATVAVDESNRATELRPLSTSPPHMLAFHLAWLSLFACFFTAFASPPLLPVLRDALNLSNTDIARAAIASAAGTIFGRLAMGPACDLLGPRLSSAAGTILSAPAVFLLAATASSPASFLLLRFLSGFSLAVFVSNQYWMSSMFSPSVVALANAVSAGWANLGSAAAQLFMPLIYSHFVVSLGLSNFTAWRAAFFIPTALQVGTVLAVLEFGHDSPQSSEFRPAKSSGNFWNVLCNGLGNYRGWILGLTYGYCYGVELTMENIIAEYFYDRYGLGIETAGVAAAGFGVVNVVARPGGGMISDHMASMFGMRGRLWGLWVVQSVGGLLCVVMGRTTTLEGSVAAMIGVSMFVQAASGLTFGVVPFVSNRSMGVISGLTGSGGALGSVMMQLLFFSGSKCSKETGISLMGIMVLVCTLPVALIYFPHWGGMFCGPDEDAVDQDSDEDYQLLS